MGSVGTTNSGAADGDPLALATSQTEVDGKPVAVPESMGPLAGGVMDNGPGAGTALDVPQVPRR
jgi:hypothetical protein